jgi:hypothetical protein
MRRLWLSRGSDGVNLVLAELDNTSKVSTDSGSRHRTATTRVTCSVGSVDGEAE